MAAAHGHGMTRVSLAAACGISSTVCSEIVTWGAQQGRVCAVHTCIQQRAEAAAWRLSQPIGGQLKATFWPLGRPAATKLLKSCTLVVGWCICSMSMCMICASVVRVACLSHLPIWNRQSRTMHTCWPVKAALRRPPPTVVPHCIAFNNCLVARGCMSYESGRVRAVRTH